MAVRVLLAEDHALVRAGLRSLLKELGGVEVVGEAGDGHEALRLVAELRPDVVLLDISMPGLSGLEVAARVVREHPDTKVLVLSMHRNEEYVLEALRAGAAGYLLKDADAAELKLALRAVARGDRYLDPAVSATVINALKDGSPNADGPLHRLTSRQREILQLIAEGHSTKDIARKLDLGIKTVETHRAKLMRRLGVHHVAGLVRYAIRVGLVSAGR